MNPDRWQQIKEIFQSALSQKPVRRSAFLDEACAGDSDLRKEVEALLAAQEQASNLFGAPAIEMAAKVMAEDQSKWIGRNIGPYKIVECIGAGGMGEVYLAKDSRLGRKVAIKMLPEYCTKEKDRAWRFKQEARAASALSHPNVATIYEIGEANGASYIVMEYIEGQTLTAKINERPLDTVEILEITTQVADALDEAHTKGVTHRDIKSANIMITARGQVKVLDFGLAKVAGRPSLATDIFTLIQTDPGAVMGTVHYMSPEQAMGRQVDQRTDIFSLGVVTYEMATGRRPFCGTNANETIDQIAHSQPGSIIRFNYNVPAELERIVKKCMEKDRERRYQSARDLLIDLKNLKRDIDLDASAAERSLSRSQEQPEILAQSRSQAPVTARRWLLAVGGMLALALLLGLTIGGLRERLQGGAVAGQVESIAVLPLVNATADPNSEYLSDGITESIINSLSQLPKLKVMAYTTVFRYKGKETDPEKIGRDLKVDAVFTGRVIQKGDTFIIQTELVSIADGRQLWGEKYNRKLSDIIAVQEEISRQITENLRTRLTGEEKKQLTKHYTENAEAYQLYLKGRYYWNKRTPEGFKKAIEYFKQAIDLDPNYALAYVGISDCYGLFQDYAVLPPKEANPKAKAAAIKALEIDDTLAEAHASLGLSKVNDWDLAGAETEYKRAIALNSNYATVHHWYGEGCLIWLGRFDEAIAEMKRARELDPFSLIINTDSAQVLVWSRHYDEAIEQCRKTLEMDQNFSLTHSYLGQAYVMKGMFAEGIAEFQKAVALEEEPSYIGYLGHAYAVSGRRADALKTLDELKKLSKQRYVSPFWFALIYMGLDDKDRTFEWLEKAYDDHFVNIMDLSTNPYFDNLRSDPRRIDLLRRVGLKP